MLFHSQVFILGFLPVVLALYYRLAKKPVYREWMLILASLVFYAWWDVRFLPLILAQMTLSWALSEWHFKSGARWPLKLGIIANLAVLGSYKYLDFFVTIAEDTIGIPLPKSNLILPIGISFYTFQIISYLIDALRNEAPRYHTRHFSLFVILFPQLVAGPIVRHNEIISQFDDAPARTNLPEMISRGLAVFVLAAAAKVLIADPLAASVDPIFAAAATSIPTLSDAALAITAFSLQIFFDFAAYSEMAIGLALMMGLSLPRNFNQPYRATNLRDFWRRWHMTLSRFLRDYVYIPLGGSRNGPIRYVFASITTMGLCGLWHGAGWTFVIWGLLHGVGLIVCRTWDKLKLPMPSIVGWAITLLFVILLFGLFRAPDLNTTSALAQGLLGTNGLGDLWSTKVALLITVATLIALAPLTIQSAVERWLVPKPAIAVSLAALAVVILLEVGKGQPTSFIYFQF